MTKFDYVNKNLKDVKRLAKNGIVSASLIAHHDVCLCYKKYAHLKSKMLRYQCTADDMRISVRSVIGVLKEMNKPMKP